MLVKYTLLWGNNSPERRTLNESPRGSSRNVVLNNRIKCRVFLIFISPCHKLWTFVIFSLLSLFQDSTWMAVRPQLQVTERPTNSNNAGDELKYTTSHTFGGDGQQQRTDVEPSSLEHGTTYVARLRARNGHGWSEWSSEVVFSGTYK